MQDEHSEGRRAEGRSRRRRKELGELGLGVPLAKRGRVVMHVAGIGKDRRPIGGAVLELASDEDQLTLILGNDRLHGELQRVLLDATVAPVECGARTMRAGVAG